MSMTNVAVIPTQANRIRALRASDPRMSNLEISLRLRIHVRVVDMTLGRGDRRRVKSVAK